MDDDTKRYKIQIKGTAYTFAPISDDDIGMIHLVFNMNASTAKTLKALTKIMKESTGSQQWDELTDRLIEKEITLEDLVKPLKELLKRQTKDRVATQGDE